MMEKISTLKLPSLSLGSEWLLKIKKRFEISLVKNHIYKVLMKLISLKCQLEKKNLLNLTTYNPYKMK